jgi:hypothetical protein
MALANFFDKNALAAHQVLAGVDPARLTELLGREIVALALDSWAAESREGQITTTLAIDLLARFYPRIAVIPLGEGAALSACVAELEEYAKAINPSIELSVAAPTRALVIGRTPLRIGIATLIYVGSDGWRLRLSRTRPTSSGTTGNPFGAGAAACLGLANVFRAVMGPYLPSARLDHDLDLSVVDWGQPHTKDSPPDMDAVEIDLAETLLGGVGAIGNSVVWALARVPRLRGLIRLIDPEVIELSNLQRYVLAFQDSIGHEKVELAAAELRWHHPALEVTTHSRRWGAYLSERGDWHIPRVATAFDSVADRVAAQASLPHVVLNAWTQRGDLGVSRHPSFGEQPCLACLYAPKLGGKSEAERVAADLGFDGAPREIRHLLYSGESVTEAFIRSVAENLDLTAPAELELLLRLTCRPLRQFHAETICGGVMLKLGVRPGARPAEVPIAFQSVLAGLMLAAEIVLDAVRVKEGREYNGPTRTALDLLRPIPPHPHLTIARRPGCFCGDSDYVAAYNKKCPAAVPEVV